MQTNPRKGEDDERKILMKIFDGNLSPIQFAAISATDGADTVAGETNAEGRCLLSFPQSEKWDVTVTHPYYTTEESQIELTDSLDEITIIMAH